MAGALLERELIGQRRGRIEFDVARLSDDPGIRCLLRENPMPGRISISLEREPNYFANAKLPGELSRTIVARKNGRLICMGSCVIRERFLNGEVRRAGYLGGLRLDAGYSGRFDILRRGYEFCRELEQDAPADFYFTSISADNERAIRLLERSARGLPRYEFVSEFITLLVSTHGRRKAADQSVRVDRSELIHFLNDRNREYQFASCWSEEQLAALESLGLRGSDFVSLYDRSGLTGCAALWDQRAYKQTVVRGYSRWLRLARPFVNALGRVRSQPWLPAVGETLASAFVSHFATRSGNPGALITMITALSEKAAERRIELLTMGFAAADPRVPTIRQSFRCQEYRSRIYLVSWPGIGGTARQLDGRLPGPEVALL